MSQSPGFGFGLGNIKDLQEAFKMAQKVQEGAMKLQNHLENLIIEGKSSDGLVTVQISGNQEPRGTVIDDSLLEKTPKEIESLVLEAMTNAYRSSIEIMRAEMEALASANGIITKDTTSQPKDTTSQPKKKNPPIKKNQSKSRSS